MIGPAPGVVPPACILVRVFGLNKSMRYRRALFVIVAMVWGGQVNSVPAQMSGSVAEQYLFAQVNAERAQRGLPELQWDAALYRAAQTHAREMAARASISHQYPGEPELAVRGRQAGARFSIIAENVAEAPTAVRIHDAWMNSPGHRANILQPKLDSVGISVVQRDGQLYAVQDFGRSVDRLSFDEQESTVAKLLTEAAPVNILPTSDEARQTCSMKTGYAGQRQPWFVMRFTAGDLDHLPEALKTNLATGRYHQAMVGACAPPSGQNFSSFNIAVLLYP